MTFYSVLFHFAKCCNLRVKVAQRLPKTEGAMPIGALPIFRLFLYKASLRACTDQLSKNFTNILQLIE